MRQAEATPCASATPEFLAACTRRCAEDQRLPVDATGQWSAVAHLDADDAGASLKYVRALTAAADMYLTVRRAVRRLGAGALPPNAIALQGSEAGGEPPSSASAALSCVSLPSAIAPRSSVTA